MKQARLQKTFVLALAICVMLAILLPMSVAQAAPFNDVDGHWAEDQINEAVDAGYISGVSDSVFSPNTACLLYTSIFGPTIDQMRAAAPEQQKHIQDNLSAFCFGDFYTRQGLDLQLRELLTFCIVSALGLSLIHI